MTATQAPTKYIQANQYLYHVLRQPLLTNKEYDRVCRVMNIDGTGGSSEPSDYSDSVIALAAKLSEDSKSAKKERDATA